MMSSNCMRRIASKSAKAFMGRRAGPGLGPTISPPAPRPTLFFSSRVPVELGCGASLLPLHSVTASALLNSLLSSNVGQWSVLSEGFATPL